MEPNKRAAIAALTRIIDGTVPALALEAGAQFVGHGANASQAGALLWPRVRLALEKGAHLWLLHRETTDPRQRPTGVVGIGYDLAAEWFPEADRRGEEIEPEVMGELIRPWLHDWWTGSDVEVAS